MTARAALLACRSASLLDAEPDGGPRRQELRVLFMPEVLAGTERTELARERTRRSRELLGISVHPHEHVVSGQPAPGDDLSHRTPPSSSRLNKAWGQHRCAPKVPGWVDFCTRPNISRLARLLLGLA